MSPKPPEPNDASAADRPALPFEPVKNRKAERKPDPKPARSSSSNPAPKAAPKAVRKSTADMSQRSTIGSSSARTTGIPETVSRRMVKRMAVFCGLPTLLGMSTFVVSYLILINGIYEVPTYAVLLVSLGFFGLGVLGLSYGALSASWDEDADGSWLGVTEFSTNWGRMTSEWQAKRTAERQQSRQSRGD
jgi:hypothetical protein